MITKTFSEEEIQTNGDLAVANMSFRETADMADLFMYLSDNSNLKQLDLWPEMQAKIEAMRELYAKRMREPLNGMRASI